MKCVFKTVVVMGLLAALAVIPAAAQDGSSVTLTLAGYTVVQTTYAKILPLFMDYWKQQTGQDVTFQESYLASGAQSRAVAGGFEADIVALSLEGDVNRLVDAGLITHDWKATPYGGMVSDSLVVLVTRKDNPKQIQDWGDLAQPGIEVITPDAATSGGAQWNVMGAYGAAFRGQVKGYDAGAEGARKFLADLFTNVSVMDASGLDSYQTFERGIGDVSITYENQYFAGKAFGDDFNVIYPMSSIVIENPIALVDIYADEHGTREAAQAFIDFLYRPEIQAIFAEDGFRSPRLKSNPEMGEQATVEAMIDDTKFPTIADPFTIDDFGGWAQVKTDVFGDDGVYSQVIAEVKGG
ncbi:MAG: sulfate ABC transporter substrate-binding protein [Chloroflexi bacterium]|nr:sulfate ABC transporter substrate-binding protein [Chloroflexota bacterium]